MRSDTLPRTRRNRCTPLLPLPGLHRVWEPRIEFASGADPGARRNESAGLHDPIEGAAVDHQIFDDWKCRRPKWLDGDRFAVAKLSHVKFTGCARMIRSVSFAVNRKRAGTANSLATIGIERNRFFALQR